MIYGELLLGGFLRDQKVNSSLLRLPFLEEVNSREINLFITNYSLIEKGIGWVDCNLLYSSKKNSLPLITLDKSLKKAYEAL